MENVNCKTIQNEYLFVYISSTQIDVSFNNFLPVATTLYEETNIIIILKRYATHKSINGHFFGYNLVMQSVEKLNNVLIVLITFFKEMNVSNVIKQVENRKTCRNKHLFSNLFGLYVEVNIYE